jgi:hypothetical protein
MQAEQQQALAVEIDDDATQDQAADAEVFEVAGSDTFEGDVESGADVEMQDS